jgi:hypothetical protein
VISTLHAPGRPASFIGTTSSIVTAASATSARRSRDILDARHALYSRARELNPARWARNTRNWTPINSVTLNPERDSVVNAHAARVNIQPLAA